MLGHSKEGRTAGAPVAWGTVVAQHEGQGRRLRWRAGDALQEGSGTQEAVGPRWGTHKEEEVG